jgi:hypothetical protein
MLFYSKDGFDVNDTSSDGSDGDNGDNDEVLMSVTVGNGYMIFAD